MDKTAQKPSLINELTNQKHKVSDKSCSKDAGAYGVSPEVNEIRKRLLICASRYPMRTEVKAMFD